MGEEQAAEVFPADWNEWRAAWLAWRGKNFAKLRKTHLRAPGKNFLADEILGTWAVHYRDGSGAAFELSEVTMPDFSGGYGSDARRRYIGITKVFANGQHESGGVVETFEQLEKALQLEDA